MPYSNRIKTLEESYRLVESQIASMEKLENVDTKKLDYLQQCKNKYLLQLRDLRKAQYEATQEVDFGDDR